MDLHYRSDMRLTAAFGETDTESLSIYPERCPMRASVFVVVGVALSFAVASPVSALPTLTSSLTNWGRISLFGPEITRSGGAKTEIVNQRTEWDHDSDGAFNTLVDGYLVQNVWTEASTVAGAPVFRSYHDLQGSAIPFYQGVGWTGFRTEAVYKDKWTFTVGGLPIGVSLSPLFSFGINSRLGDLFPPGGSIALPPDYYPFNPLWGGPGGGVVIGPLPTAPNIDLLMSIDNFRWYDAKNTLSNIAALVPMGGIASLGAGPLTVQNGVPFDVEIDFTAGWRMDHREIAALLGPSFQRFSTNRVLDASHTGALSAVEVFDGLGILQQAWSLTDSQGVVITPLASPVPVPGPAPLFLSAIGAIVVLSRAYRRSANHGREG